MDQPPTRGMGAPRRGGKGRRAWTNHLPGAWVPLGGVGRGGGHGPITYQGNAVPLGGVGRGGGPPPPSLVCPTMPRGERREKL